MRPSFDTYRKRKRIVTHAAAAIFMLAQFLGIAHFHLRPVEHRYSATAVATADDGLCAVCVLHFHSAAAFAIAPSASAPTPTQRFVVFAAGPRIGSSYRSHRFGRAP